MIKKIKQSLSEKVLFIFLILLIILTLGSFYILSNKCLFVKKIDLNNFKFKDKQNIAIMEVECGKVLIELDPNISPKAVNRFKKLVKKGSYNGSAFYRVIENTLIQAGDIEYGNISNINYSKVGTGKSGLGTIKSELSSNFLFNAGSVAFARKEKFDTEDSEFFITLIDIPIYQGEYTPIGRVIAGLDSLKKIKAGNKSTYVLKPDYIKNLKLLVN
ncbi:peptidylprolyl isomerase [Candidatus Pelagibacter sp.]|nr:peptidylprolyl isomerase [Candidatus Pelagibacter sp.]